MPIKFEDIEKAAELKSEIKDLRERKKELVKIDQADVGFSVFYIDEDESESAIGFPDLPAKMIGIVRDEIKRLKTELRGLGVEVGSND